MFNVEKCPHCARMKEAQKTIDDFFEWNSPENARDKLMNLLLDSFSNRDKDLSKEQATDQLFFITQLSKLMSASYELRNYKPGKN